VSIPAGLVSDLFVFVAMIRNWRTRGRPHAVHVVCGAVLLAEQILAVVFAGTSTWDGDRDGVREPRRLFRHARLPDVHISLSSVIGSSRTRLPHAL
jgi:hypothetical protein